MFTYRDYFMVGERVRFLFTSELVQANEFVCNNSRVNKNRIREPTMMLFVYFIIFEISFNSTRCFSAFLVLVHQKQL